MKDDAMRALLVRLSIKDAEDSSASSSGGGGATPIASSGNIFDTSHNHEITGPGQCKADGICRMLDFSTISAAEMKFFMESDSPILRAFLGNINAGAFTLFATIDHLAGIRQGRRESILSAKRQTFISGGQGHGH